MRKKINTEDFEDNNDDYIFSRQLYDLHYKGKKVMRYAQILIKEQESKYLPVE